VCVFAQEIQRLDAQLKDIVQTAEDDASLAELATEEQETILKQRLAIEEQIAAILTSEEEAE